MPAFAVPSSAIAPTKALAGAKVDVLLKVGNVGTEAGWVSPVISVNGVVVDQTPGSLFVEVGQVGNFNFSFIMPNQDAVLEFAAFHWDGAGWVFDMKLSLTIFLVVGVVPAPKYQDLGGTFSMEAAFA